jgi:prepilin-type N-terminal cleavage/methylation domain-containing protein
MKQKGFTLIEILWVMALLGVIMTVVVALYVVALKNYQINFTKSGFQKDLNFTLDDVAANVKQSVGVLQSYSTYNLSATTLIISLPATDVHGNFQYTGGGQTLVTDTFIYYLSGSSLHRKIFADTSSIRYSQNNTDTIIASSVSSLSFTYLPTQTTATEVQTTMTMSKTVENTTVRVSGTATDFMRNIQQ